MSEAVKGIIECVGYIDPLTQEPQGWAFNCMGIIPALEIRADSTILYAGYTVQELQCIATLEPQS